RVLGDSGYTAGRAVSLVATLVGAYALAWSVRRLGGRWSFGLLAAGFFLTQNVTLLLWASLNRADALALAFTLLGLACAAGVLSPPGRAPAPPADRLDRRARTKTRSWPSARRERLLLAAAALLFALAAFTKQTFLVAPLAVAVTLWPRWRTMLGFSAGFGG